MDNIKWSFKTGDLLRRVVDSEERIIFCHVEFSIRKIISIILILTKRRLLSLVSVLLANMQGKLFHGKFYVIDLYIGTMIKRGASWS